MEPIETTFASPPPTLDRESTAVGVRRQGAARRRATALLAAATALFAAVTAVGAHGIVLGYVQAGAETAIVGGILDWFAVTSLFRRPLRLPIPHTVLIVNRTDQFATTLSQFVQDNFLDPDVLVDRIRSARLVPRLAAWLANQDNATRLADLLVTAAQGLRAEDQGALTAELTRTLEKVQVAPLAGKALRIILAKGRHAELLNTIVSAFDRYLADHYTELRQRFEGESSNWMPGPVYRLVFDRLHTRLRQRLAAMAANPDDRTRRQFEDWLVGLPDRLETSPDLRERGERLKRDMLARTELWQQARRASRTEAADPEAEARHRLPDALMAAGLRLESDRSLQEGTERAVELGARVLVGQFHDELTGLVTRTIERWDALGTSSQLETRPRPDLRYIRLNGMLVGACVGLVLHAIALTLA